AGTGPLGNTLNGIAITSGAASNTIGGTAPDAGNTIAFNGQDGVIVTGGGTGNAILRNRIFGNTQLGIDLANDGFTTNDAGDGDGGPNNLQNFPVLGTVQTDGTNVLIQGSLGGLAVGGSVRLEFFASILADPSNHGEGERFLDWHDVRDGGLGDLDGFANGTVTFSAALMPLGGLAIGERVSATATLSDLLFTTFSDTSEFGLSVGATTFSTIAGTIHHDVDGDADVSLGDGTLTFSGATVRLYRDGGDGLASGVDDVLVGSTFTDPSGQYVFTNLADLNTYWVVVDSRTLDAGGYLFGGINDVWAEQTYASAGAASGAGFTTSADALYGGRDANISDDASTLARAEHMTRAIVAGSDVIGVDSAFSFSAVTTVRDGDDDALNPNRTVQGSLRQFILNSNAFTGKQTSNFSIGGISGVGVLQSIAVTGAALPIITDEVTLDAWTQGASGYTGPPLIELNGAGAGAGADGFLIAATSNSAIIRGFVINGFEGDGIHVEGNNTIIAGNYIGTDASGGNTVAGNDGYGVYLLSSFNRVGGAGTGEGNVVARNGLDGVVVESGTGNRLLRNSIHSNGGLGIDLVGGIEDGFGVTANDPSDGDAGANLGMNTPVLYSAVVAGGNVTVTGEARPGATLEFFAAVPDPSGAGEGQTFLFSGVVSGAVPGAFDATARQFSFTFTAGPVVIGSQVTATATDPANNTSEFSYNAVATGPNTPPTIASNGAGPTAVISVAENTTAVTDVDATDPEAPPQTLMYSIVGGPDAGLFTIDLATGVLGFSAPPDFETPADLGADNIYDVTVQVSD
ncbi:MAG: beta strand repeat-containing protein, partial [Candidatus Rokuibacteriota bacterium]